MKIIYPTLERQEPASEKSTAEIVPLLENNVDPFLSLKK